MPTENDTEKPGPGSNPDAPFGPDVLEWIESGGIEEGLKTRPGLLAVLCRQVASQGPFTQDFYELFMKCYWEGVEFLVRNSPPLQECLAGVMPLTVNLEATDTSLSGHFRMGEGKIHGGPGMVHFRDQDYRFFGSTQVLMMFLNNELPLGYADLRLHSEGHPGLGRILFPVMRKIAQRTRNDEQDALF